MDQVSPADNIAIHTHRVESWNRSSPSQSPVTIDSSVAPYPVDDSYHLVVNVETAPSESGGSLCDAHTPGRSLEADEECDTYQYANGESTLGHHASIVKAESQSTSSDQTLINDDEHEQEITGKPGLDAMPSVPFVEPGKKDPRIHVTLEGGALWRQFFQAGTEMIITRSGRRMFPGICVSVCGLDPDAKYAMHVDMNPADNHRYKFINTKWVIVGKSEAHCEDMLKYIHPDSPATGRHWMSSKVSFKKIKVTNNKNNKRGQQVSLNSMHRYMPRVVISKCTSKRSSTVIHTQDLHECCFIAVTAYQNDQVTQLKIDHNPFAKAFRDNPGESDMYGYGMMGTWPPISPLLSPYGNSFPTDIQAMQQGMLSPSSIQSAGPSPLPQFNTAFGNWESPPYSPAATYKPHMPGSSGVLPSPAFPDHHRQMMWNASKLVHDSPPISPLVHPSNTYSVPAQINPSVYQFPAVGNTANQQALQDDTKSPSLTSARYQPWLKQQTSAPTYHVSGSPVGYGPTYSTDSSSLRGPHAQVSAFAPPKVEPAPSPLCSTSII